MYYCKDNNVNYYKYSSRSTVGMYQKFKNIDFWKISTDILSYLLATLLLALFLIFGYLYITKQSAILSSQINYLLSSGFGSHATKFPTYMVKSQKILLAKQEIARIDKFLTDSNQRKASKKELLKKNIDLNNIRTIVVKKGDTLYTLAEKAYGNASYYRLIFDANPKILKSKRDLYIWQVLRVPF